MSRFLKNSNSFKIIRYILPVFLCLFCLTFSGCHLVPYSTADFPQMDPDMYVYDAPMFLSMDKKTFAAQATDRYRSQNSGLSSYKDTETIDELILQAVRLTSPEREPIHEQLTTYGVYAMPYQGLDLTTLTDETTIMDSDMNYNRSVYLSTPMIYYQVPTDQWIVAFSGTWLNDDWKQGKTWGHDLGGRESFGVHIEDHGNYPGMICNRVCGALYSTGKYASIESSAAYDSEGNPGSVSTGNRSYGTTADGFGFQLQDRVEADFPYLDVTYLGYSWAGLCVYSSEFAELEGTLTAYYIHTYGDTPNGYELPLGQDNALDGIPVDALTGDPLETAEGYFVRYSQGLVLSPAP